MKDWQIERYRENGFVQIPNFINEGELPVWQNAFDSAISDRLENNREFMTNQMNPKHSFARTLIQCNRLADTSPDFRELLFSEKVGEAASSLMDVETVRVWHDQALIKPPYGNATTIHLDAPYWSFYSEQSVSLWIALDRCTYRNGCMFYLPSTHKTAEVTRNVRGSINMGELVDMYPEWSGIEPMLVPCEPGDAIWHHGMVAHGAGANIGTTHRRAMTCIFMPDGVTYNGKRNSSVPEDYAKTLKVGDILNNDEHFPVIWTRNGKE